MPAEPADAPSALLALAFALAALLYSSVGHGGASGYLAVMGLAGTAAAEMKPIALVLNVAVSGLAFDTFARAGHFRSQLFLPLAVTSLPCAFWGGSLQAPAALLKALFCLTLVLAAWRLLASDKTEELPNRPSSLPALIMLGGVLGFLSGLLGIGGGIFLTPLLIFLRWAQTREAAAVSAAFILVNSLAGLGGFISQGGAVPSSAWVFLPGVIVGGFLGSAWGGRRAAPRQLRQALAAVLLVAAVKFAV